MNYVLMIMFRFREVSLTEFCMVHNWWMEYPGGSSLWWGPCCLCSGGSSLCRGCYWLYQGGSSLHRGWYWLYQGGSSLHRGWYWLYQWGSSLRRGETDIDCTKEEIPVPYNEAHFWLCSEGSFYDEALADSTLDEVCVKWSFAIGRK